MAITKGKADAGQGGKIGHSNQNHWGPTEEVKDAARKWRRLQAKLEIAAALSEIELTDETEQRKPNVNDELPQ
jgi:outer membrane receptor for monomeric catechols